MTAQLPRKLAADGSMIRDDREMHLATVFLDLKRDTHAIAAEMVKRWNAHKALIDALREARSYLVLFDEPVRCVADIDEALKLAGEPRLDPPGCVSA